MPRPGPRGGSRREGFRIRPGVGSGPGGRIGGRGGGRGKGGYWSLFDNLDRNWLTAASYRGREAMEADQMFLTDFTVSFSGGSTSAYPYRRAANVVTPCPGEGVRSGNGTPVGGGTTAAAVRRFPCPSPWSGYFGGELAEIMRK